MASREKQQHATQKTAEKLSAGFKKLGENGAKQAATMQHDFEIGMLLVGLKVAASLIFMAFAAVFIFSGAIRAFDSSMDYVMLFTGIIMLLVALSIYFYSGYRAAAKYSYSPDRAALICMAVGALLSLTGFKGDAIGAALTLVTEAIFAGIVSYAGAIFAKSRINH